MKAIQFLALAICLAIIMPAIQAQSIDEPRFVNRMLDDFSTPSIAPGRSGVFSFTVNNPDLNLTSAMENVTIAISIYHYATLEESVPVSDIDKPPVIAESGGTVLEVDCGDLAPGGSLPVEFTVQTQKKTPHGSYFSQSTYFVKFMLAFSYGGQNYTMASRGHFNDTEWSHLTEGPGNINRTYLKTLGYDGIIPDSAFSVRLPIPKWPFFMLVGLTVLCGFMAFSFHVLDNPGKYPKLEIKLLRLSGRMAMWKLCLPGKPGKGKKQL